ncbi:MAG TPA: 2-hydroxychromene-2-carboxylate isomerase [Burkholderiales bacterium]|nr:2-hydroxychromene-2-carboxylate isomerase [Burkholderiales bacterium]
MANPIDFYFDFSSPYGYLASTRIDALAAKHGRSVVWRPHLLGAVFKINDQRPLASIPLKSDYAARDLARSARLLKVPFKLPTKFPVGATAPSRAFYWLNDKDRALAKRFAQALYHAYFAEDRDISSPEVTCDIAARLEVDRVELAQALNDPAVKERLRTEVDAAIARGVFGSPYIVVDGEPFWGSDRLDQVERWLETGGW